MTTIPIAAGGRPKRLVIDRAFGHLGSAGYEFDRTPEEVSDALDALNMMMTEEPWNLLGWVQPDYGPGTPDELSGLPDKALFAVSIELADRLSGLWGATLPPRLVAAGARARSRLFASLATIPTMPLAPNTPRGAGNRRRGVRDPFIIELP